MDEWLAVNVERRIQHGTETQARANSLQQVSEAGVRVFTHDLRPARSVHAGYSETSFMLGSGPFTNVTKAFALRAGGWYDPYHTVRYISDGSGDQFVFRFS